MSQHSPGAGQKSPPDIAQEEWRAAESPSVEPEPEEGRNAWDDRPLSFIRNLHLYAAMCSVVAIIVVISAQVVLRTFFNSPLIWAEEFSRYLHIWIAFLGITVALRDDGHVRIDYFISKASPKVRRGLDLFAELCSLALALLVVVGSCMVMWNVAGQATPTMRLPVPLFFAATLIGFLLFASAVLVRCMKLVRGRG